MHITKKIFLALICSTPLMGANIVFDLHGVLLSVRQSTYISMMPLKATAHYVTFDAPSFKEVRNDWFAFLALLANDKHAIPAYDESGQPVPAIMTSNLKGTTSCAEVCARAKELCASNNPYFRSAAHRDFMYYLTCAVFTPEIFLQGVSWFDAMIALAIDYKKAGHNVYVLSNLNDEQYAALAKRYPQHLAFFDGICISGTLGMVKPDPAIYKHLLATFHLNPAETIFIDDQKINCDAATNCGITSILCPTSSSWYNVWHTVPDAQRTRQLVDSALTAQARQACVNEACA